MCRFEQAVDGSEMVHLPPVYVKALKIIDLCTEVDGYTVNGTVRVLSGENAMLRRGAGAPAAADFFLLLFYLSTREEIRIETRGYGRWVGRWVDGYDELPSSLSVLDVEYGRHAPGRAISKKAQYISPARSRSPPIHRPTYSKVAGHCCRSSILLGQRTQRAAL